MKAAELFEILPDGGKMERILQAYGLPKKTFTAIMMLYKNTNINVPSLDSDTDFFDIVTGVLQVDTLAPFLFIICQDYLLRMSIDLMKETDFTQKKATADDTPHKLLRSQTRRMTWHFWQMHQLEQAEHVF